MNTCAVCDAPCRKNCSRCNSVFYCSREHQVQDWAIHQNACLPFKLVENGVIGRCLVATRTIKQYDLILREPSLVHLPYLSVNPCCLGCYREFGDDGPVQCPFCGYPLCSLECSKSREHYPECNIITKYCGGTKVQIESLDKSYPAMIAASLFRCLALKEDNPDAWNKLNQLRFNPEKIHPLFMQYQIPAYIRNNLKCLAFTKEEIIQAEAVIACHSHQTPRDYISIYWTESFLKHNCIANCFKSFADNGDMEVRACRTIEAGENIFFCRTDPLKGTSSRNKVSLPCFVISCKCRRCTDPTELGTHFSSLKCKSRKCNGFIIPKDPINPGMGWHCTDCRTKKSNSKVNGTLMKAKMAFSSTDGLCLDSCIGFIRHYEDYFHPNHYLLTDIKLRITDLAQPGELSDYNLNIVYEYTQQLAYLLTELAPSRNARIASVLINLYAIVKEMQRRNIIETNCVTDSHVYSLMDCKNLLVESYQLLRYDAVDSDNGIVAIKVKALIDEISALDPMFKD